MTQALWIFAWLMIGYLIGVLHTFVLQIRNLRIMNANLDLLTEQGGLIEEQRELIERLLKT